MLALIWKNISRRRARSTMTITITLLTVMVFVMVMGVFQTVSRGLELSRQRLGADAVLVPKYSDVGGEDLLFTAQPENIYMSADVVEKAAQLEGVAEISPQFYARSLELACCDPGKPVRVIGIEAATDFVVQPYMGELQGHRMGEKEMVVGANVGNDLAGFKYLLLGRTFDVIAELLPTGTGMDSTIFIDIDVARDCCLESETLAAEWEGKDPYDSISVVMIKLKEGVDPQAFAKAVRKADIGASCIVTGDTLSSLQNQLSVTMKVMFALWLASMLIAVLALAGRFNALARERKKEIGLLRAIGLNKGQVFGLIIGETCTMALIGGIVGSGLALFCMNPLIERLRDAFMLSPSVWTTGLAALCGLCGVLLAVVLGFITAVIPASGCASLDPQTAITQGEVY